MLAGFPRQWTRQQHIRTLASLPLEIPLVDRAAIPVYQRIAEEALQLRELGWSARKIAQSYKVDQKTAVRALEWACARAGLPKPKGYTPGSTLYEKVAKRAAELRACGLSLNAIGKELGTTGHTVKRALDWAARFRSGGES